MMEAQTISERFLKNDKIQYQKGHAENHTCLLFEEGEAHHGVFSLLQKKQTIVRN